MDENANQPIGEPQPIDPRQGRKILKRMAGVVALVAGGLAAFATLLAPTRLSGASRSARLQWQQRQKEIQETIKRDCSAPEKVQRPQDTGQKVSSGQ
jgi:hypothetical protein